jgi:hypothetical protein
MLYLDGRIAQGFPFFETGGVSLENESNLVPHPPELHGDFLGRSGDHKDGISRLILPGFNI